MSLEDAIAKLTASVDKQNGLLEKMMAAAPKTAAAAGAGKPADKPADKPAAAGKPAGKTTTTTKKGETTAEDAAAAVTNFLKVPDPDLKEERKAQVKQIIDHYGAARFTTIDPANFDEAIAMLKTFADGETPEALGGGEGDGEDDGADMV